MMGSGSGWFALGRISIGRRLRDTTDSIERRPCLRDGEAAMWCSMFCSSQDRVAELGEAKKLRPEAFGYAADFNNPRWTLYTEHSASSRFMNIRHAT